MQPINFHNKTFSLLENSKNGKVNSDTIFEYKQEGNLVTAEYHGGTVRYGKIIAMLEDQKLDMLYQCVTTENELKAGKAVAGVSLTENGKIKLELQWAWLGETEGSGTSVYLEN